MHSDLELELSTRFSSRNKFFAISEVQNFIYKVKGRAALYLLRPCETGKFSLTLIEMIKQL